MDSDLTYKCDDIKDFVYSEDNIFYKIINKEAPAKILYEDNDCIVIFDVYPVDTTHLLFIPKIKAINFDHLIRMDEKSISRFYSSFSRFLLLLERYGLSSYRLLFNNGKNAGQQVFHLHVHILSCELLNEDIFN